MTELHTARLMLVTIRLPKQADHDPHNKIVGPCPLNGELCTDVRGEHHTLAVWAPLDLDADDLHDDVGLARWPGARVTRVETTNCTREL